MRPTPLDNIGGAIIGQNSLAAVAGRDMNISSTTNSSTNAYGGRTNLDRIAGLYVTGGTGNLTAYAGHDLTLTGATATNQGSGGATLAAGNDLNLDTVRESFHQSIIWNASNYHKEASHTDIGSTVQSMGDLRLSAGQDITLKAANVTAETGNLLATASRDINLTTGEAYSFADDAHQSKSKGFLSSKTTNIRDTVIQTTALGSTLSGETATVIAGQDLNILGGNIVSTTGTTLLAGQDVNLLAATNTSLENHFKKEKKSGLLGASGGIGFTIGSQMQSTDQKGAVATALGSVIGSTEGDVSIQAGRNYVQVGSDVLAPLGDIDIGAQRVDILEARETSKTTLETKTKQTGVTIGVTNPVLSAVQTIGQLKDAAGNTSDTRMKTLAGATAGLSAYNTYDAVATGQGQTINGKDNQVVTKVDDNGNVETRDATTAERMGGVNVSVSFGASSSQSNTTQTSDSAAGSTVAAGGNVRIGAVGAGANSDLTIQGSTITAGRNVNLLADDEIRLLAAQNLADLHSANKSSSGSIGLSYGSDGLMLNIGASGGRGKAEGTDLFWNNTHVEAGNQLILQSGGDTLLRGAVVSGRQAIVDVGGNLNIESLQDLSTYDSKQQSMGGSLSVGYGRMSGSVSASKSTVNSDFASVTEQSGIKAGDEGFDVNVKGATDLKGAVIASTDKAVEDGKNSFTTAGLAMSDIQNRAEASAESSGFTLDSSMFTQGKYGIAKAVVMNALDNAEASSSSNGLTKSAISGGAVTITDEQKQIELTGKTTAQTLTELNRDTANAHTAAQQQDVQALQKKAEAERTIKETAMQVVSVNIDEAYHTMFEEKHPVYVVETDANGNPIRDKNGKYQTHLVQGGEQLQTGPDGKVNVATNGIYNSPQEAINNAMQNADGKKGPMYVVYFPQTGNVASELFVAGYQKTLEGDWTGLTNSTSQIKDYMGQYGQSGLNLYGHSRGAMTIGNALDSQANSSNGYGSMSNTNIYLYGPAANAQNMAGQLSYTSGGAVDYVYLQNHNADFVGSWLGGNPSGGYNQIPEKSSYIGQMLYIVGGAWAGEKTVHSCYGNGGDACTKPYGLPVTQIINSERVQLKK